LEPTAREYISPISGIVILGFPEYESQNQNSHQQQECELPEFLRPGKNEKNTN
jgi:hypothetical protein